MKTCKILGIPLAFVLALASAGCGSAASTTVEESPTKEVTIADEATAEETTEEVAAEEETEENEISGIIALVTDTTVASKVVCTVVSIDPDTGEQQTISTFKYTADGLAEAEGDQNVSYHLWPPATLYTSSGRELLSDDFSKLAITKSFWASGEIHAGWIDESGEFYDVIAALEMEAQSDSDTPACYSAEGFIGDYYVFSNTDDGSCYYVPMGDISAETVQAGNPLADSVVDIPSEYLLTDWIDSTHCLVDDNTLGQYSRIANYIYDTTSAKFTAYIPEATRYNWNSVLSPDGTTVAFLSMSKFEKEIGLYTASLSDGTPTEVKTPVSFRRGSHDLLQYPNGGADCIITTLVDWK